MPKKQNETKSPQNTTELYVCVCWPTIMDIGHALKYG